jgi:hypothetical protein
MRKRIALGLFLILAAALIWFNTAHRTNAAPLAQITAFPTPTPGPDGRIMYTVKTGDSLWRISAVSGISLDELRLLNNLGPNDIIIPGQELLLGLGGPAGQIPTQGAPPTPTSELPTPTPGIGTATLCVLLYEDINGDALRQEEEISLPGGAISINDRFGEVSITKDTPSGGISDNLFPEPEELGFTCTEELEKGEYNATVAIPDGYNATTPLSYAAVLNPGDEILLAFGAQPNTDTSAQAPIPTGNGNSPLIGILGGFLLIFGLGMWVYITIFKRR